MSEAKASTKSRIFYIDNLRIFLTFLVVLHHWAIANGAPGDWYYDEENISEIGQLFTSMFVATNQAFFMGFFFFISAYFLPRSLEKKGTRRYVSERLLRLGIPLLVYIFIISPSVIFLVEKFAKGYHGNIFQFYMAGENIFANGPLWFVAMLLIFSLLYLILQPFFEAEKLSRIKLGKGKGILLFSSVVLTTFFIRIYWPVGEWIPIIGIQPAHLTQYVCCFALGIIVFRTGSLEKINPKISMHWFLFGQLLILIIFPTIFVLGGPENVDLFMGGLTWHSFVFSMWEQSAAVSLIIGLLGITKKYFNRQSHILKELSQNSYAIYILHSLALVILSLLVMSYNVDGMVKFVILAIPAILFSYLLAKLVRLVPAIRKIV